MSWNTHARARGRAGARDPGDFQASRTGGNKSRAQLPNQKGAYRPGRPALERILAEKFHFAKRDRGSFLFRRLSAPAAEKQRQRSRSPSPWERSGRAGAPFNEGKPNMAFSAVRFKRPGPGCRPARAMRVSPILEKGKRREQADAFSRPGEPLRLSGLSVFLQSFLFSWGVAQPQLARQILPKSRAGDSFRELPRSFPRSRSTRKPEGTHRSPPRSAGSLGRLPLRAARRADLLARWLPGTRAGQRAGSRTSRGGSERQLFVLCGGS